MINCFFGFSAYLKGVTHSTVHDYGSHVDETILQMVNFQT